MQRRAHMLFLLLFSLLPVSMSFFMRSYAAHAASTDPITITSQSSTLSYPKNIDFQVNAHDTGGNLQQATLYIKYNQSFSYTEQHDVTATKAGKDVTFTWLQNTANNAYNPVGTTISYYWIITDDIQNTETSKPQSLSIIDNRFQWQQIAQKTFRVHWYGAGTDFGQMLATQVSTNIQRISQNLGTPLTQPVDIWVYSTEDDFHNSLSPHTHEWVGGIAFPRLGQSEIVVTGPGDDTLRRDLPHELTHLIFHQQTRTEVPLWFDEGLAVYNQKFHEPDMTNNYNAALQKHALLHLQDISAVFPADATAAYLAYAQSWMLLDYMYKTFGQQKMAALIQSTHLVDHSFNEDLQQSIGLDISHLENQWRLSQAQPPLTISGGTASGPGIAAPLISLQDPLQPYLFTVSILLIVFPLLGCGGFLTLQYQRRKNWATHAQADKLYVHTPASTGQMYAQRQPYRSPSIPDGYRLDNYRQNQDQQHHSNGGHL